MLGSILAASPQFDSQGAWLAVAAIALIVLYVLMRPKNKKEPSAPPRFPLAKQREVEEQMNNLLVELSQMARQITSQLDTRAAKLEILIKEADERLLALQQAKGATSSLPAATSDNHASEAEVDALHPSPRPGMNREEADDPRYQEVYALADEGRPLSEIAKVVQRPAGEVELILALRPK